MNISLERILRAVGCGIAAIALLSFSGYVVKAEETNQASTVIVLDPEGDSLHTGASCEGINERDVNFRLASYCLQELSKYTDVQVSMSRMSANCPGQGASKERCDKLRVYYGAGVKADAFIRIGMSSSADKMLRGFSLEVPNTEFSEEIGKAGEGLAACIEKRLALTGMESYGIKSRDSQNGQLYPDGSAADFNTTIRTAKQCGFPAVVLKHAFISNIADNRDYLQNENMLKKLGQEDAKGIADYFDLHRDYSGEDLTITATPSENTKYYTIKAEGMEHCHVVHFAVWSLANGQDDIQWFYPERDSEGNWSYKMAMKEFATEGIYAVHVYITRRDGTLYYVGAGEFELQSVSSVREMLVSEYNRLTSEFSLEMNEVTALAGVSDVAVSLYRESDPENKVIYKPVNTDAQDYSLLAKLSDVSDEYGKYIIELLVEDGNGITKVAGSTSLVFAETEPQTAAYPTSRRGYFNLELNRVAYPKTQTVVDFEVYGPNQEDVTPAAFKAGTDGNGTWTSSVFLMGEESYGSYKVLSYITDYKGNREYAGEAFFEANEENIGIVLKGDANVDGNITLEDANLALRAALGIIKIQGGEFLNADIDEDGDISILDANIILKIGLGIIVI